MLWTRILGAFLAIILVALTISGLTAALLYDKPPDSARATTAIADHIVADLPKGDELQSALERKADALSVHLALWTASGQPIARSGPVLPHPKADQKEHRWARNDGLRALIIPLTDGRTLTVAVDHPDDFRWLRMLLIMVLSFGVLGAGSYIIARRLTDRLERLTHQVNTLHPHNLNTKVDVSGKDEVAALATAFNESVSRIATLVDNQKQLLAMVSHELRSPLARIRMAVELMETGANTQQREEVCKHIEELDELIGDLLLASRLDLQTNPPSSVFDVSCIIQEEAERVNASHTAVPTPIRGDPQLARRAIRNLLENAARHGEHPIEISCKLSSGVAEIIVDDQGDGVPIKERKRIFEPFYRPDGYQRGVSDGAGLGLFLVAKIARSNGGSATCSENSSGGARFVLTLPTTSATNGTTASRA